MTNPTVISQYAEEGAENIHIPWKADQFFALTISGSDSVELDGVLQHVARAPQADINTKTYFLQATGYNFDSLPDVLSGIQLTMIGQRRGRITDDVIQLCLNGQLVGLNQATLNIGTKLIYGSPNSLWDSSLTVDDIQDPTFGVVVRLRSHPSWPHRDGAFISGLELTIY